MMKIESEIEIIREDKNERYLGFLFEGRRRKSEEN
jgi:hypothetical protein